MVWKSALTIDVLSRVKEIICTNSKPYRSLNFAPVVSDSISAPPKRPPSDKKRSKRFFAVRVQKICVQRKVAWEEQKQDQTQTGADLKEEERSHELSLEPQHFSNALLLYDHCDLHYSVCSCFFTSCFHEIIMCYLSRIGLSFAD